MHVRAAAEDEGYILSPGSDFQEDLHHSNIEVEGHSSEGNGGKGEGGDGKDMGGGGEGGEGGKGEGGGAAFQTPSSSVKRKALRGSTKDYAIEVDVQLTTPSKFARGEHVSLLSSSDEEQDGVGGAGKGGGSKGSEDEFPNGEGVDGGGKGVGNSEDADVPQAVHGNGGVAEVGGADNGGSGDGRSVRDGRCCGVAGADENLLNTAQARVMTEARAGNCVKVIGPAGSGKTTVQVAVANEALTWNNETVILWIAPYNSQVDSLKSKLRKWPHLWEALKRGKHVRTAASVFGFPKGGGGVPERMAHRLSSKDRALLQKPKLLLLIDEADLLTPTNRDVMSRVLQIVRGDPSVNGGVQIVEVGDPMHLGDNEKADSIPGRKDLGARKEITVEAEAMKNSALKVVMLTDTPRFDTKLYRDAAAEARLGFKGPCLIALLELACKRVLTAEEELSKMSLFGTNKQVMDCSLPRVGSRLPTAGCTGMWQWEVTHWKRMT